MSAGRLSGRGFAHLNGPSGTVTFDEPGAGRASRAWIDAGPAHHLALMRGDRRAELRAAAAIPRARAHRRGRSRASGGRRDGRQGADGPGSHRAGRGRSDAAPRAPAQRHRPRWCRCRPTRSCCRLYEQPVTLENLAEIRWSRAGMLSRDNIDQGSIELRVDELRDLYACGRPDALRGLGHRPARRPRRAARRSRAARASTSSRARPSSSRR